MRYVSLNVWKNNVSIKSVLAPHWAAGEETNSHLNEETWAAITVAYKIIYYYNQNRPAHTIVYGAISQQ